MRVIFIGELIKGEIISRSFSEYHFPSRSGMVACGGGAGTGMKGGNRTLAAWRSRSVGSMLFYSSDLSERFYFWNGLYSYEYRKYFIIAFCDFSVTELSLPAVNN